MRLFIPKVSEALDNLCHAPCRSAQTWDQPHLLLHVERQAVVVMQRGPRQHGRPR